MGSNSRRCHSSGEIACLRAHAATSSRSSSSRTAPSEAGHVRLQEWNLRFDDRDAEPFEGFTGQSAHAGVWADSREKHP